MWQRIQSLYLFLAICLNLAVYFLDLAQLKINGIFHSFSVYGVTDTETGVEIYSTYIISLLLFLSILMSTVVFFMFKKRQVQIKLSQLNLFIQMSAVASIFFLVDSSIAELNLGETEIVYEAGAFFTIIPLLFIYLAIRSTKKDEALIRAADRIR